ncbi:TlpA family protein disulfide reductase [Winogradskyella sp. SM1960]|uniref:TlpA family protein disulfide reductase n=1 Tax=Winogradskyella sp. SM1960 TaxID=2865955 RepID=UPI001CD6EE96|nr:TlpA disulfide reductase family protein [Winogradskyella sp. SM1960]
MNNLKMNNNLFFLVLTLILIVSCEKKEKKAIKSNAIVVTGQVENVKDTTLNFSYYAYDFLQNLTQHPVEFDSVGKFKMRLESKEPLKGWFSFGRTPITEEFSFTTKDGKDSIVKTGTFDSKMLYLYLKQGDSMNVAVDADDIKETLNITGDSTDDILFAIAEEETFNDYKHKYLKNWYDVSQREPNDFKQNAERLYNEKMDFLNDYKSKYNLSEELIRFYEINNYATLISSKINYPSINSSYNNNKEPDLPEDYFDFLKDVNLDYSISENGIGYFYSLKAFLKKKYDLYIEKESEPEEFYDWLENELPEKVRYEYMAYSLSSDFSNRLYNAFDASSPYPEMAKVVREKFTHLEGMLEGSEAPDVKFENTKGESVSLSDFRGKYTYIDLWATWCGPCIKEIPSLQKVEKQYHGKNIQFVSISFDKAKDHEKWLNFVKEKSLTGHQLIASKETHDILSETYNIKMIPRFIFLDPEGKVIDATAPFPSDPMLLKLFDKHQL